MHRTACAAALLGTIAAVGLVFWVGERPIPDSSHYMGSAACWLCHEMEYAAWKGSQHNKMMRPVDGPGVVVAHFDANDAPRFPRSEAVWAIGGKWEQQFMGRQGSTETLLPGAWLKLAGHWNQNGWDGWEAPVPLKRCHGCHTVGLDVEAGRFVEANIGCESCHGPASWHVRSRGIGRVYRGLESDVCGQCHSRGQAPTGGTYFPTTYKPGKVLAEHFDFEKADLIQSSSHWWGNGSERDRHQEFTAWSEGGHADALRSLTEGYDGRYGEATRECLGCHSAEAVLTPDRVRSFADARNGITCAVCHTTHGGLGEQRIQCSACHDAGAYHHRPERNAGHVPCPREAGVQCQDCHMPRTVAIGGELALHSHRPGFVRPQEAAKWDMPSGCQNGGCHAGVPPWVLQAWLERSASGKAHGGASVGPS